MSSADLRLHRTYLYAPGDRPDLMRKALVAGADAVVLDLEDSVAPSRRGEARRAVEVVVDEAAVGASCDVMVRIPRGPHGYLGADLDVAVRAGVAGLRLAKAESADEIAALDRRVGELEERQGLARGSIRLDVTIESAVGAIAAGGLLAASPRISRAGLGAADLLADIGAAGDDDLATLTVRSQLVLVSRAVGVGPPIDSVHTALDDEEGLRRGAVRARALGFIGKSVIHPRQIGPVHEVFTPTPDEVESARRTIAAHAEAETAGVGALGIDGEFIDAAVAARARAVLALASIGDQR